MFHVLNNFVKRIKLVGFSEQTVTRYAYMCLCSAFFICWVSNKLIDRSIDRSIDWLIDRSIDRLIDWSIDRSIDWLMDWLIDWSIDRSIDRLIDWLIDRLIDRLIDWSIDRLIDWLIDWQGTCQRLCGRRERVFPGLGETAVLGGRRRNHTTQGHHPDRCHGCRRVAWNVEDLPVSRRHSGSPVWSRRAR